MATPEPTYHTADMVRALNAANPLWTPRYETIWGELHVSPSPRPSHQFILERIRRALWTYLEREPVGVLAGAPADISWGRDDILVQPDLFIVTVEQARAAQADNAWTAVRHLLLAVEVLSPSSVRADRFAKRTLYQKMGVPLYWIVDVDAHTVEVWTPDAHFPTIERESLTWHPAPHATPFVYPLADLFRPI
ncbi:MAG: Uma2 family endonuclease [Gemmatirosa sp.]